jgi:hypothetical protein
MVLAVDGGMMNVGISSPIARAASLALHRTVLLGARTRKVTFLFSQVMMQPSS